MNRDKLKALRDKYTEAPFTEVERPEYQASMLEPSIMSSGMRTLVDAPYQESLEGLDIALVGVPWDLGVTHRPGARIC